jgi:hypothetical protein
MRSVLNFFSMLALGLMVAAILVLAATGAVDNVTPRFDAADNSLDYMSVIVGLGIGVAIAVISQVSWADLPRRSAAWLVSHGRRIRLFAWAALFVAVLLYY